MEKNSSFLYNEHYKYLRWTFYLLKQYKLMKCLLFKNQKNFKGYDIDKIVFIFLIANLGRNINN